MHFLCFPFSEGFRTVSLHPSFRNGRDTHTYIATYMYEFTILLLNLKVSDHSPISSPSLSPMSSTSPWIAGKLMYHSCLSI